MCPLLCLCIVEVYVILKTVAVEIRRIHSRDRAVALLIVDVEELHIDKLGPVVEDQAGAIPMPVHIGFRERR